MARKRKKRLPTSMMNPSRFEAGQIKLYVILIPLALFSALPILYLITTAFKPLDELFAFPPRFFVRRPSLRNFQEIMRMMTSGGIPFSRYLFNTLVSSVLTVVGTIYISLNSAYVLSKKRFRGKKLLFTINTAALMFVPAAVKVPRYLLVYKAGMLNTFWALVVPMLAMPVGLFLIKQNLDQVPDSLIEAARIDGAKEYRILYLIVAPVIKPALVTVAILSFQTAWNNVEYSQLYINNDTIKTFAFYISSLTSNVGNTVAGQGMAAAGSLILFLPNLLIFIIMQSKVVNTMANSGIK